MVSRQEILVVDDDPEILYSIKLTLLSEGISDVTTYDNPQEALEYLGKRHTTNSGGGVALILLDINMPGITGGELLGMLQHDYPEIPVIMVTANDDIDTVVRMMSTGASDYLLKPVDPPRLIASVKRGLELHGVKAENDRLKETLLSSGLKNPDSFSGLASVSDKMFSLFRYVEAIAASSAPILILGETGTGKELMAKAIHLASGRSGEFVAVNLAGLDDAVFSDTLFGHKKGAYTGADGNRPGLVEKAAGGTLFLDEIGDLAPASQVKLLRLLQEREYYQLGSDILKKSAANVVLATMQDIVALAESGKFRKDLYYRLRTHIISLPPLRERKEDIAPLLDRFLSEAALEFGKNRPAIPKELHLLLTTYNYPGNVRELRAMVFDAVGRHEKKMLSLKPFKEHIDTCGGFDGHRKHAGDAVAGIAGMNAASHEHSIPTLKDAEDWLIAEALRRAQGNQSIAAKMLGLTRSALNKRINRPKDN